MAPRKLSPAPTALAALIGNAAARQAWPFVTKSAP
jgi:hypothetical protein